MSSPLQLRSRFRFLLSRAKGKLKSEVSTLAYELLKLPLKEKTIHLAQEQCLAHAAQAFQVFGHTTLRGILSDAEVAKIAEGLDDIGAGIENKNSIITFSPIEKSRKIQEVVFSTSLLDVLRNLLPPFWYYGSDACVGVPVFTKHRDMFYSPPFLKIFIPLVPCTFSILPGSHWPGDSYSREVSRYASDWDSGIPAEFPAAEVHFSQAQGKTISDMSYVDSEDLFLHRQIEPGDIFIFNTCAVHGLITNIDKNFFLAFLVLPSPLSASSYGLTRTEHLERIIANISSHSACEYHLSKLKKVSPEGCLFTGYKFSDEDFARLIREGSWHDCFGLRFIEEEKWRQAFEAGKHQCFERLQDTL